MRLSHLSLLIGLTASLAAAQPSPQSQVESIAAQHHGKVSLFAEDLTTHATVAIDADRPVQTASVIKLSILYEALLQIRAGTLHFDDRITLTKSDQVPGSGVLLFLDTPVTLTFKDILTYMTMISDNTAANLAMDHVGIANVNRRMAALGLKNTYLYKKVFTPVAPGTVMPDDQRKFGLGKTTAREMAALITRFAQCRFPEPAQPDDAALCTAALKMLHVQFYRNAIPRYLDGTPGATGDSIASKSGSLDAVRNDVAAISTKNGMVVISAFTFENEDHSWTTEQQAELTISKLARAIVTAWSPQGLAPWPAPAAKTP